jgi:hypothetical protein
MRIVSIVATIAVATMTGSAAAQTPNLIRACVKNDDGNMRFVTSGPCKANETLVTWNQSGPAGPAGAPGSQGIAGPAGAPGPGWALEAANRAVLYGMQDPTGELILATYALVPLHDGGLAGVPVRFINLNGLPHYMIDRDRGDKHFETDDCTGDPFLKAGELSLYFGSTRLSAAYRGPAGLQSVVLGVAKPGSLRNRRDLSTYSNGNQCVAGNGEAESSYSIDVEVSLTELFPGPITPRAF